MVDHFLDDGDVEQDMDVSLSSIRDSVSQVENFDVPPTLPSATRNLKS